ncbi:MAG: alpha/beta hydrolase [Pseudomonadota bacterium]
MAFHRIEDWSDAYENRAYVPDFSIYPPLWEREAEAFRQAMGDRAALGLAYGEDPRQTIDLFHPSGAAQGLVYLIHGGYWRALSPRDFSHLAGGAVARGWAVALPAYRLAPTVSVPEIVADVRTGLALAAAKVAGPVILAGHSAGGHLACRLACTDQPLDEALAARLGRVVSISGLHDLRPLIRTDKNDDLRLDLATAMAESPALLTPRDGLSLTAWVGGRERPEFLRQSALITNVWTGLGTATKLVIEAGKNHFDVIDSLGSQYGSLTETLFTT